MDVSKDSGPTPSPTYGNQRQTVPVAEDFEEPPSYEDSQARGGAGGSSTYAVAAPSSSLGTSGQSPPSSGPGNPGFEDVPLQQLPQRASRDDSRQGQNVGYQLTSLPSATAASTRSGYTPAKPMTDAAPASSEEEQLNPGCCCSDTGGCCGSSNGGCCFSDNGGCCFSDTGGCCGSSNGGCCFSDNGGCCFSNHGGCCFSNRGSSFCL